ncbi:MSMEG_0567/Sll0786 family nitrogen starvation N-acetyltransferase [Sphingomonas echinoides]|uniref:MSMEG_0567/Sll0786 family nitrogen starvation N-acetyltransferase n=1 Tax=Sphingomonas echinoides TaxID=59803 RepID=UPI002413BE31|nr:MSMEG_0567/Sll0786 family nitrogen starvation N-acetyltransferase [Sphingomonas echinoides]
MDLVAPPPFLASDYIVRFASERWEAAGAAELRRQVFCTEQRVFDHDDRDATDAVATTIVALSTLAGGPDEVIGTVRIHQSAPGIWWGSRLAVAPAYRRVGIIGPALIRLAVSSAHAMGCVRFFAHVQSPNELLFRRLHWAKIEQLALHGREHLLMQADLAYYPPIADGTIGFHAARRAA